jgi:hypothetical protein
MKTMKPKFLLGLALVLSGGLVGCSSPAQRHSSKVADSVKLNSTLPPYNFKCGPDGRANHSVPAFADVAEFHADDCRLPENSFKTGRYDLQKILETYFVISEEHWWNHYSHMPLLDRTGTITLKNGTVIRWLVGAGGLAVLTFPDQTSIYLANQVTP